ADCQSSVCTGGFCAAPLCGDGVKNGVETCDDGPVLANGDGCSSTCTVEAGYTCNGASPSVCAPTCGDGIIKPGEACDDGNVVSGDCCSSACQLEAGCEVEPNGAPATANTITLTAGVGGTGQIKGTIIPIGDNDYFKFTLTAGADVKIQTFDGTGAATCGGAGDHDTVIYLYGPDGVTQLSSNDQGGLGNCSTIDPALAAGSGARQLAPGTYFVRVQRYLNSVVIPVYRLLITVQTVCGDTTKTGFEGCDDGGVISGDGCSSNCAVEPGYTCAGSPSVCVLTCGNGILDAGETCDQGGGNHVSGDGCSNACLVEAGYTCAGTPSVCTVNCGNGVINAGETCDQGGGNVANGDGCSSTCTLEPNFQCTGTPSVCVPFETSCGDGLDNDGDSLIDNADDDCVVTVNFPPCAAGQTRKVYRSTDTPLAIPDSLPAGITSNIMVAGANPAVRSSIVYNITHTFDSDVDMFLTPPGGASTDVCTDNGSSGDNFVGTVLDNTCAVNIGTLVTAASAPFTGCFKPENVIATTNNGTWALKVADDAGGDTGTLNSWAVILCTSLNCGNGVVDAGEQCDQGGGNIANGDGCSASCQTEAGYTCAGTPSVCTPNCGNGVIDAGEVCDQGGGNIANGDGCSSTCQVEAGYTCSGTPSVCITIACGNGVIQPGETCDQGGGNVAAGDGCSPTCQLEANFQCTGTPSVCVPFETSCGDGMDNDGDALIDAADDDCVATINFPPCAAGQTRKVFRSTDTPIAVPDSLPAGITSTIIVAGAGTVVRSSIVYNITHTWDSDVDMFLTPPGGASTDVCTDNGSSGANFVGTVLDNTCSVNIGTLITAASAPFTGCFKPENVISTVGDGNWALKVADDTGGDTGTLNSWAVLMCTTP
ncbi:MAG: DUF4215 domain-containing protein, partial [Minicystis sp.]